MRRKRQRGFSLLEVLSAMTLFALVASALGGLATTSMTFTMQNKHATLAAMIGQQQLEDLRSLPYASILPSSTIVTMQGQAFTVATGVIADSPAANMKDITVTVSWTGPEGSKSYAFRTIYTSING